MKNIKVIETDLDTRKHRNSSHLASCDVEIIINEKGKCKATIENYVYGAMMVNGVERLGYYIFFKEDIKPWKINSTERKKLNKLVKLKTNCTTLESLSTTKAIGLTIYLCVKPLTKEVKGKKVDYLFNGNSTGINIDVDYEPLTDVKAKELLSSSIDIDELNSNFKKLSNEERAMPSVIEHAKLLKAKL
jgi:hypothetical protein